MLTIWPCFGQGLPNRHCSGRFCETLLLQAFASTAHRRASSCRPWERGAVRETHVDNGSAHIWLLMCSHFWSHRQKATGDGQPENAWRLMPGG
eukprot:scaffold803_cov310-Pinguiococcus_pyrenoidosus.AAC.6